MIVSVVNREVADDANSFIVDGRLVWLRVSRIDGVYAYHASIDGVRWQLVRVFVLALEGVLPSIGLQAQSPTGGMRRDLQQPELYIHPVGRHPRRNVGLPVPFVGGRFRRSAHWSSGKSCVRNTSAGLSSAKQCG
jgi:Protein of unknown function (DUF1349)